LHQNNGRLSQFLFTDGLPMARWIAFDQKTSSILRSTLARGTRIDTLLRGPIDYALARPSAVIAVLPAGQGDFLGIATFRRARAAVTQRAATEQLRSSLLPPRPAAQHASTRAGGFLGLSDEPVFDDEAPQEKKGWWRKFWDE
jgi:hypothetical protein